MSKRMTRRDPIESVIELALSPGAYIRDRACISFVSRLEGVAAQIDQLQKADPARAAGLYESFLAGCKEKAEELDDSSGSFGQFARDLICRWITATQTSGAGPDDTAETLLGWISNDPYAFCYQIEKDVAKALNKAGLAAFARLIRARFEAIPSAERYDRGRWGDVLRAIYFAQRNPSAYEALAEQIGLEPRDCLALATISVARKRPADSGPRSRGYSRRPHRHGLTARIPSRLLSIRGIGLSDYAVPSVEPLRAPLNATSG